MFKLKDEWYDDVAGKDMCTWECTDCGRIVTTESGADIAYCPCEEDGETEAIQEAERRADAQYEREHGFN